MIKVSSTFASVTTLVFRLKGDVLDSCFCFFVFSQQRLVEQYIFKLIIHLVTHMKTWKQTSCLPEAAAQTKHQKAILSQKAWKLLDHNGIMQCFMFYIYVLYMEAPSLIQCKTTRLRAEGKRQSEPEPNVHLAAFRTDMFDVFRSLSGTKRPIPALLTWFTNIVT